jgi:hypothetical protein
MYAIALNGSEAPPVFEMISILNKRECAEDEMEQSVVHCCGSGWMYTDIMVGQK